MEEALKKLPPLPDSILAATARNRLALVLSQEAFSPGKAAFLSGATSDRLEAFEEL